MVEGERLLSTLKLYEEVYSLFAILSAYRSVIWCALQTRDMLHPMHYLNRINTNSDLVAEFVGVMIDEHMVAQPEVEEGEDSSTQSGAWL